MMSDDVILIADRSAFFGRGLPGFVPTMSQAEAAARARGVEKAVLEQRVPARADQPPLYVPPTPFLVV